jgi:hypothetical protein
VTVHQCPPDGESLTPCCGRTPLELPHEDQIAVDKKLVTCHEMADHLWPDPADHLWSDWRAQDGLPKPTQVRTCIHPQCTAKQTRKAYQG